MQNSRIGRFLVTILVGLVLGLLGGCGEATMYDRCMAVCESQDGPDGLRCDALSTNVSCHFHCGYNLDRAIVSGCDDLAEELISCQEMDRQPEGQCVDCFELRRTLNECVTSYEVLGLSRR